MNLDVPLPFARTVPGEAPSRKPMMKGKSTRINSVISDARLEVMKTGKRESDRLVIDYSFLPSRPFGRISKMITISNTVEAGTRGGVGLKIISVNGMGMPICPYL